MTTLKYTKLERAVLSYFNCYFIQTVFDPMFISVYNLFYTSLPVLALGIFDQDVNDVNSLKYPKLYTPGHLNLLFNKAEFFKSAMHGCLTSCVLFFIPYGALSKQSLFIHNHALLFLLSPSPFSLLLFSSLHTCPTLN